MDSKIMKLPYDNVFIKITKFEKEYILQEMQVFHNRSENNINYKKGSFCLPNHK